MFRKRILSRISALVLGLGAMSTALAADKPVALIIAQGGLGDQSYNDLAYAGFKKAIAAAKLEGKPVESKDVVAQAADILRRASDAGFGLVVDLEYSHGDALGERRQGLCRHGLCDPQSGQAGRQCRLRAVPGAGGLLSRRRAGGAGRHRHVDQGRQRQADHRRDRRHQIGRHRQIHRRLHPGRARHESESRGQGRLFQQFRRSGDRPANGQGDVSTPAPMSSIRSPAAPASASSRRRKRPAITRSASTPTRTASRPARC